MITDKKYRVRVAYNGHSVDGGWTPDGDIHVEVGDDIGTTVPHGWYTEDTIEFDDADELNEACELCGELTDPSLIAWGIRKALAIREAVGLPDETDWIPYSSEQLDRWDDAELRYLADVVGEAYGKKAGMEQANALGIGLRNRDITFEVCRDTEWLRDNAGLDLDEIEDGYENEAADHFGSELHARLTDAGFKTEPAKSGRILYHGWNGANTFKHRMGPIGTFDDLTQEQQEIAWHCIESARAAAVEKYRKETEHATDDDE